MVAALGLGFGNIDHKREAEKHALSFRYFIAAPVKEGSKQHYLSVLRVLSCLPGRHQRYRCFGEEKGA